MVEQFSIEDGNDAVVLVRHGLVAVGKADNAEASRRQANARLQPEAFVVWAAMPKRIGHAMDGVWGDRSLPCQIENARDAAHGRPLFQLAGGLPLNECNLRTGGRLNKENGHELRRVFKSARAKMGLTLSV